MQTTLKVLVSCLATAILTYLVYRVAALSEMVLFKNGFLAATSIAEFVPSVMNKPTVYLYDTVRFGVLGAIAALLMLLLRPRIIWLYSLVSICTLYFSSYLGRALFSNDALSISLAITWLITIPVLYALFVRLSENRHNKSFKPDTRDAGAS